MPIYDTGDGIPKLKTFVLIRGNDFNLDLEQKRDELQTKEPNSSETENKSMFAFIN